MQHFGQPSAKCDAEQEKEQMDPVSASQFQFEDLVTNEILCERCDGLDAEAGAGGTHRLEPWDNDEVQQDVDDHTGSRHQIKLLEAAVGREQRAENVCGGEAEKAAHQDGKHLGVLAYAYEVSGFGLTFLGTVHQLHDFLTVKDTHDQYDACHSHHHIERGLDQIVEIDFVLQSRGKHGQQHDGKQVGNVVACVEQTIGTTVDAGLHPMIVDQSLQQERLDAAIDAHQQDKQGEGQALYQYFPQELEVDLEAQVIHVFQHKNQRQDDGAEVGQSLHL